MPAWQQPCPPGSLAAAVGGRRAGTARCTCAAQPAAETKCALAMSLDSHRVQMQASRRSSNPHLLPLPDVPPLRRRCAAPACNATAIRASQACVITLINPSSSALPLQPLPCNSDRALVCSRRSARHLASIARGSAMAEWQVHQRHPGGQQPGGGGVEWYSSGAAAQYGASSYGYDMPAGGGGGGAAYGSFEDEAPLLEGLRACWAAWGITGRAIARVIAPVGPQPQQTLPPPPAAACCRTTRPLERSLCCPCAPALCRAGHRHSRHPEPHAKHPDVSVRLTAGRLSGGSAGLRGGACRHAPSLPELRQVALVLAGLTRLPCWLFGMRCRLAGHDMDNLDLGGPLIFMALLGFAHLLVSPAAAAAMGMRALPLPRAAAAQRGMAQHLARPGRIACGGSGSRAGARSRVPSPALAPAAAWPAARWLPAD